MGQRAAEEEKIRPWKIGLGLNGFASASKKYKKTFPIWEVLDFASRKASQRRPCPPFRYCVHGSVPRSANSR
jgi:hypothetical protein